MAIVRDILDRNIEQQIAPVVYFHKQDSVDLEQEVREYVITTRPGSGGEAGGGIHEQYVSLLNQIIFSLENQETSLPASWISGFFGSGKSSFAKLLGLALDGKTLPDGSPLSEALLQRDDTPQAHLFREAWSKLTQILDPMAVVFDIGAVSRSDEAIHKTVYREIQKRLGYSNHEQIAYFERLLEDEGQYTHFLELCLARFRQPWDELKNKKIAPQRFSALYSEIYPDDYPDPMDWFDIHQSDASGDAQSVQEAVKGLSEMLKRRAAKKSLFVIVDEMSQHVNIDDNKRLNLQTLVSELGAELKGRVWLLVTGQERLGDAEKSTNIGKLQDRFPPRLRVHLDRANVGEIVFRRLLKKRESTLENFRSLLDAPGVLSKLKLHGFETEAIQADQLISHYPLLPGHITLLMDISQGIRNHSTRLQADSASVRGVLQIIWELFNHTQVNFKSRPLGDLVTLDQVYDILRSALNSDTLLTMDKIEAKSQDQPFKFKVAKAIALLEMVQDSKATSADLIAQVLYPALGAESVLAQVKTALQELENEHFIIEQEKLGWRIQDHAGQDWIRSRDEIGVAADKIQDTLYQTLGDIMETIEKSRLYGTPLPWNVYKSDMETLTSRVENPAVKVDFRFVTTLKDRNDSDAWVALSKESIYFQRFVWVCGDHNDLHNLIRQFLRSDAMIKKHEKSRLDRVKERLLQEEKARKENLEIEIPKAIRTCWLNGQVYFNGTAYKARDKGSSFENALKTIVEENLDSIFPYFKEGNLQISKDKDLAELFKVEITSPNSKFLDGGGLGLIQMDAGRVTFSAHGPIPTKIKEYLQLKYSVTGQALVNHFGLPPYGYPRQVLKACLVALLRTEAIVMRDAGGSEMTSYKDPGVKDLFLNEAQFNRCEIIQNKEPEIGGRDKVACAKFFSETLHKEVERDSEALTDAVFQYFGPLRQELDELKDRLRELALQVPQRLHDFGEALDKCRRDRRVQATLLALKQHLEVLKEGVAFKNELAENLSEPTVTALKQFQQILSLQVPQLQDIYGLEGLQGEVELLNSQLNSETPWRGYADVQPALKALQARYVEKRQALLDEQQALLQAAVMRVRARPDFGQLTQAQSAEVLRVLEHSIYETLATDTQPALIVLKQVETRLQNAEAKVHDLIDEALTREDISEAIVKIPLKVLSNRTLETENDLNLALDELREQCLQELQQGKKVRFV